MAVEALCRVVQHRNPIERREGLVRDHREDPVPEIVLPAFYPPPVAPAFAKSLERPDAQKQLDEIRRGPSFAVVIGRRAVAKPGDPVAQMVMIEGEAEEAFALMPGEARQRDRLRR